MLRSNRLAILALGLIASAGPAEPHNKHHQRQRAENGHNPISPSTLVVHEPVSDIEGAHTTKGCEGSTHPEKSCDAIAADAAIQQARDADWQTGAAWSGVVIGLLTLVAAGLAAWYARRAAEETEKSAKSAALANTISRSISRPWIKVAFDVVGVEGWEGEVALRVRMSAQNIGQLPAYGVKISTICPISTDQAFAELNKIVSGPPIFPRDAGTTIFPNDTDERPGDYLVIHPGWVWTGSFIGALWLV